MTVLFAPVCLCFCQAIKKMTWLQHTVLPAAYSLRKNNRGHSSVFCSCCLSFSQPISISWILLVLLRTCYRNRHVYSSGGLTNPKQRATTPRYITTWSKVRLYFPAESADDNDDGLVHKDGRWLHVRASIKTALKWVPLEGSWRRLACFAKATCHSAIVHQPR